MYMSKTETNITFEINDGSGSIPARLWVNPEEQQTEEDWRFFLSFLSPLPTSSSYSFPFSQFFSSYSFNNLLLFSFLSSLGKVATLELWEC